MASVCVAVRIRPLNKREKQLSCKSVAHLHGKTITLHKPLFVRGDDRGKVFSYDFTYDSTDATKPTYASQERIFQDLGYDVLKSVFEGFNACVFAYGQTGSGKSYTMMGRPEDKGLIPRICEGLFCEISQRSKRDTVSIRTEVSFLEIYNERVLDLLKKRTSPTDSRGLRVREHPRHGPYVENLSKHLVHTYTNIEELIVLGNANRTTASMGMNDVSSRSHAIFSISFTQTFFDAELPCEMLSKIHLVDLAGSERAATACSSGIRLKEGANINKSLVTLGSVISALADLSVGEPTTKKRRLFVPYRDSVLTWLLKDSLGGNSKTTMIATISPADQNYGETLCTLRYASRARTIVNSPMVNEDSSMKMMSELQAEVTRLRQLLEEAAQKEQSEAKVSQPLPTVSFEKNIHLCPLRFTNRPRTGPADGKKPRVFCRYLEHQVIEPRNPQAAVVPSLPAVKTSYQLVSLQVLRTAKATSWLERSSEETVALKKDGGGVVLDCRLPHLIRIDEDLLSTGIILYYLKEGRTLVGSDKASCSLDIALTGPGFCSKHCVLENHAGTVTLIPQDGALCSVNGSVVTGPRQLTQGAIIQLGRGNVFRFNHPAEAAQLRERCQIDQLSPLSVASTDSSESTWDLSSVTRESPGRMEEKLKQQEVEWQQVQESLKRCNGDIKRLPKQNTGLRCDQRAGEKTKEATTEETDDPMDQPAEFKVLSSFPLSATADGATATPGKSPVLHSISELDGDMLESGVSTRDVLEPETDQCHKSGPELTSEQLWRKIESEAEVTSYKREEMWSGDASLQQTIVLGPCDGCSMRPEGNANEIQGDGAYCCKGRPGSGGSSLSSVSHLQSSKGTISTSVLSQTSNHTASCPPGETIFEGQLECGDMDEYGDMAEEGATRTVGDAVQSSWLGSWISLALQDAQRHLWSSPPKMRQVREKGRYPFGARWSTNLISLVKESKVLSVMRDNRVFSLVKGSRVLSAFKDCHIFSMVKDLPLIQHLHTDLTQHLWAEVAARIPSRIHAIKAGEMPDDQPLILEAKDESICDQHLQEQGDANLKPGDQTLTELLTVGHSSLTHEALENLVAVENSNDVKVFRHTLLKFPDSLVNLQNLPLEDLMVSLRSVLSTSVLTSQRIIALFWLNVAKCSQPEPRPALLILMETALYTVNSDSGPLVLFHHLPLSQLKEVQIGLAGHSLRVMGTTAESILGLYTHSQKVTKELCWAILGLIYPGNSWASQPLLHADWKSLEWKADVPDLLLDAGLRVCCHFQRSLADLVYLLHSHMEQEWIPLGEVQLLLYTSVRVCISSSNCSAHMAQLLLTSTHLGLVQEDIVFHPTPCSVTVQPSHPQFRNLRLRRCLDVHCVLVHHGDRSGTIRVDVMLANGKARGHPHIVNETASPPAQASNSSHAEVWKLTFSCSAEAACLINHLSNV